MSPPLEAQENSNSVFDLGERRGSDPAEASAQPPRRDRSDLVWHHVADRRETAVRGFHRRAERIEFRTMPGRQRDDDDHFCRTMVERVVRHHQSRTLSALLPSLDRIETYAPDLRARWSDAKRHVPLLAPKSVDERRLPAGPLLELLSPGR